MKYALLGLIFGLISYLGYKFGDSYKEKEKFYAEFNNLIIYIKNQISFYKTDIIQILNKFNSTNKDINLLIKNYQNYLNGKNYEFLNILTKEENQEILNFLKGVGLNDCLIQNEFLEKNLENFKVKLNDSKNLNLKYGVLYKKLGVLFAIFICIVLIWVCIVYCIVLRIVLCKRSIEWA